MTQNREHFEAFEAHTRVKHLILRTYFDEWARKLLLRPGAGDILCFVDACAGAGVDKRGNAGSPVLAAERAQLVEVQLAEKYQRQVQVHTVAIEQSKGRFDRLKRNLEPFGSARALRGTLAEHIASIFAEFGDAPMLFFIDPFGLEPLRADIVKRALSGSRNEILALFADQAALRHFGAATAQAVDVDAEVHKATSTHQGSLFDVVDPGLRSREEQAVRDMIEQKSLGRELTRPAATEILTSAFGGDHWRAEIEKTDPKERRTKLITMYEDLLRTFGASHPLSLPMRNEQDRHVYHLVYATKSPRGYSAMKGVLDHALKHGPLPGETLDRMRFQIRSDLDAVEAAVRKGFAGHLVRWVVDGWRERSIKRFVLEETPAFPFELAELKERLKPLRLPGRGPEQYRFPFKWSSGELGH
jgi:three-Cys-motif partner protein